MFGDHLGKADEEKLFEEDSSEDIFNDDTQNRTKPFAG